MDNNFDYYLSIANERVPDWKSIDKNELFNMYLKYESNNYKRDGYLSAILLRYWGLIGAKLNKSCGHATFDDCYNWLVDSVMTALTERKWRDQSNKLYMDRRGPDKVVNKLMKMHLITHFQALKKNKREVRLHTDSSDDMQEDFNFESPDIDINLDNCDINYLIHELCLKRKYLEAIVSHIVCFCLSSSVGCEDVSESCAKYLASITPDILISDMNKKYGASISDEYVLKIFSMDTLSLKRNIQYALYKLSKLFEVAKYAHKSS